MKKNKAKTTFISVLALGFVLVLVMFMYYYTPTKEKTDALKGTNSTLQARVNTLEQFYNEMPEKQQKIEDMTKGIKEGVKDFPADVLEEDAVYFAIASLQLDSLREMYSNGTIPESEQFVENLFFDAEEGYKVDFSAIGIGKYDTLAVIEAATVKGAQIEGFDKALYFQKREVAYQNVTSYENLKGLVQSVNADKEKKTISSIAYTLDDEGNLKGTMNLTYYALQGTEKKYVPKDFGEYMVGLTNLFAVTVEED